MRGLPAQEFNQSHNGVFRSIGSQCLSYPAGGLFYHGGLVGVGHFGGRGICHCCHIPHLETQISVVRSTS